MKQIFSGIILLISIALLNTSCGSKKDDAKQQPPPAVPVSIATVQQSAATYYDEYPATITSLNEVEIRPQVSGYITGIFFKDGQHVTKGQKLYTIDQQQYRGAYEQAIANLNVAKANQARAQQDADRYQQLADQDAIARQTLEHAVADLNTAKSQVAAQQANVVSVETNLKYSTIYAPLTGTIGISLVKLGAAVSPGATLLNTLSSDDPIAVDFSVNEKEINRFVQLQKKGTDPHDSIFTISLPDGFLYPLPGQISLIDRAIDPQTGTIKTRLVFTNKDLTLRSGMTCTIKVKNENSRKPQILIPFRAVTEQMGEYFVYVVGDSSKVSQKKLVLGRRVNDQIIVLNGLEQNERIVTDGVQKLKEGVQVKEGSAADSTKGGAKQMSNDSAKGK